MSDQLFPPLSPTASPPKRAAGPAWNTLCAAVVGLLVVAYVGVCIAQLYMLNRDAADASALSRVSPFGADLSTIEAHIATEHRVATAYQIVFWAMFIAFFGWNAIVRSKLREIGLQLDRRSSKAWLVWRIGLILSLAMIFVVPAPGSATTLEEAVSGDHRLMFYFGVRAAVGLAYLWVTYVVWSASAGAFGTMPPRPVVPAYRLPEIQTSWPQFPQAPHAYEPPAPYQPPTTKD